MKKKLLIFFFLVSLIPSMSKAEIGPYCDNKINQSVLKDIDNLKIESIEVKVDKYRSWTRNSLKILIGNFRWVPQKYKKRFDANVIVKFKNNLICNFKARIRHSGDEKDHISLKDNSIIQSIDVHLKTGHISGITKFKLLRPNTRGNFEDEILLTELLREFNYLSPRTSYVKARINEVESKMIFQEKATKELLEFNHRREGPILEGDERFMFRLAKNIPDNQLSNEAIGTIPLLEKGVNAMLSKQTNSNWIIKSKKHSEISYNALSNLNLTYLLYLNRYKDDKNNFYYSGYTLDNNLLALYNPNNVLKLDIYNLIVFSANGWHGLVPNNRKFYWNSLENFFEPINYDSNANINSEISSYLLPFSEQIEFAFNDLEVLLNQLDIKKFNKKIKFRGLNLSEDKTRKKIKIIKNNLLTLKDTYLKIDPEVIAYNRNSKIEKKMWNKYYKSIYEIDPNIYLVKHSPKDGLFEACENKSFKCASYNFNEKQIRDLVEGRLVENDKEYQYLWKNVDSENLFINSKYKKIKFQDSFFYFDENIKYAYDKEKNEFNIYQNNLGAKSFFYKGFLKDININFFSYNSEIKFLPPNYPIDQRGLTGCLSLILLNVKNVSIKSNNSSCEDAVNLINVKGSLNQIDITNSYRDALDIDFSIVDINYINITSAGNDCVDLSKGNYKLNKLSLLGCGDKALSVGEKSFLELNDIYAEKSNIGVSAKDSSIVTIENTNIKNSEKCLEAKRKKQEFSGGILNIKNLNCHNSIISNEIGSFINRENI